jgi:PqqD family protein of HPr-rel-A system
MGNGTHRFAAALTADLVTEQVGDELVVYDSMSKQAHCLNPLATAIFQAADGETSAADLAAIASRAVNEPVDVPAVEQALEVLAERGLVSLGGGGVSRRSFIQRSAAAGGAAFGATLVTSVLTPAYGAAASLSLPTGFSSLSIVIKDCAAGTYYALKWDSSNPPTGHGATTTTCGNGAHPGSPCDGSWPPVSPIASGCPGFTVTATTGLDSSGNEVITITVPSSSYQVEYWMYHYGNSTACGSQCPNNFSSPNATKGTINIPICA